MPSATMKLRRALKWSRVVYYWLQSPNGFVGASPDGFVGEDTVVEVKCPWRMKKSSILELCSSDKSFFLFLSGDDTYALKKKHDYYHQIQGQMYLSGRIQCHMIIWLSLIHI